MELKNRSFLKLLDYTPAEIGQLLELAADLKAKKKAGIRHDQLRGKNIALIFEKTSTRTRQKGDFSNRLILKDMKTLDIFCCRDCYLFVVRKRC